MKYFEIPDFHFDPAYAELSRQLGDKVSSAIDEHEPDFIAIPGDLFNRPIWASEKGGLSVIKGIIKSWCDKVPVVAIEGTKSHDAPGCYQIFEDMPGFTLLKPGVFYGLYYDDVIAINITSGYDRPLCILYGVPELNKDYVQSQLQLSAEAANAKVEQLFSNYIDEFILPTRMYGINSEIPAVGLLHGPVTDASSKENEIDIVLRSSEIIVRTDDLKRSKVDRWSLGHIHTPWESSKTFAGYAGSPGLTWNEKGFITAFNLIDVQEKSVTRVPYGTPERVKVYSLSDIKNDGRAYWLETDNHDDVLPGYAHEWSRVTFKTEQRETERVDKESIEKAKSLFERVKLFDPEVPESMKPYIEKVERDTNTDTKGKIDAKLESLEVSGSIFFKADVSLTLSDKPYGIIGIKGHNGDGKSSLLSFCSLYPVVIGKDTLSGRSSAIKDFFDQPESFIKKQFKVNGETHIHHITIKGAHTENAKVECYLTVNGKSVLEKSTFDEMFSKCEELYGSFEDYRITTFYEQPQQASSNISGLMSCGRTAARDVVQDIAGIDREKEKAYALEKVSIIRTEASKLESKISVYEDMQLDTDELEEEIDFKEYDIDRFSNNLSELSHKKTIVESDLANLRQILSEKNKAVSELNKAKKTLSEYDMELISLNEEKESYSSASQSLKEKREKLKEIEAYESDIQQLEKERNQYNEEVIKVKEKNSEISNEYNTKLQEYNKNKSDLESTIRNNEAKISTIEFQIESLNKACPNCGYINEDSTKKIHDLNEQIEKLTTEKEKASSSLKSLSTIDAPVIPGIPKPPKDFEKEILLMRMITSNKQGILSAIEKGVSAQAKIESIDNSIASIKQKREAVQKEASSIVIDNSINESMVKEKEDELSNLEESIRHTLSLKTKAESQIEYFREKIKEVQESIDKLNEYRNKLSDSLNDLDAWKYIANVMSSNKLPAFELEIELSSIDERATSLIQPFMDGLYSIRTDTQQMGKKKIVDRFDIVIINNETGTEQSLFTYNPGNKAFFSDCYIKSLITKRNERWDRMYSPIICDEQDAPIEPERVSMFYDIQTNFFQDKDVHVLVVSQKDAAYGYIQNMINMKEIKK